jgi:hypothetical protein
MDWQPGDVMCCTVVQNEAQRLPFFLTYYRERGIAKFFFIDNDSTDGTLAFLLEQPDVYVWHSPLSFRRANYGSAWFEVLLRRYGQQHWWLMVDADELFVYPACETKTLPQLSCELERRGKKAFNAVLLDMYADVPVRDTTYCAGQSFLDACPFFDRAFYHRQFAEAGPFRNQTGFRGGARERVFGGETFYLSKVPLLFYEPGVLLAGGQHWTNHPKSVIAGARGALLHFKFFSTFHAHVAQEVAHRQHAREAYEYHNYARRLQQDPALTLYHPAHSVKYENSAQLVRLGIMQDEPE